MVVVVKELPNGELVVVEPNGVVFVVPPNKFEEPNPAVVVVGLPNRELPNALLLAFEPKA